MTRPIESDYTSQVAYTRALEAYCDSLAEPKQEPVAFEEWLQRGTSGRWLVNQAELERFVDVTLADEREDCAKFFEDQWEKGGTQVAAAIRARGNK